MEKEELKETIKTEETKEVKEESVKPERGTPENPKVLWKYTVTANDIGAAQPQYSLDGLPLTEGSDIPSIDAPHIAADIVDLGRRIDHQMIVEEAAYKVRADILALLKGQFESAESAKTEKGTDTTEPRA